MTTVEHEGFELDEHGGLWRCVHSASRIAGVGATQEGAKRACEANMVIAGVGVPEQIEPTDMTPTESDG